MLIPVPWSSLLTHVQLYLLATFYEVRPITVFLSLGIDIITTYIPFRLLRPLSLAHLASNMKHVLNVPNNEILTSTSIQIYTTILAGIIYAVTLYTSFATFLPVLLATYFDNIPTIEAAHTASPISLFPLAVLLGFASKSFIFTPAVAVVPSLADAKKTAFNPATSGFWEHLEYNFWSFSRKTKVVFQRTVTLMLVSGLNTFIQALFTIEGVEAKGAAGFSMVWTIASGIVGAALGVVSAA